MYGKRYKISPSMSRAHLAEPTIVVGIEGGKDLLNLPVSQTVLIHQDHLSSDRLKSEDRSSGMTFPPCLQASERLIPPSASARPLSEVNESNF